MRATRPPKASKPGRRARGARAAGPSAGNGRGTGPAGRGGLLALGCFTAMWLGTLTAAIAADRLPVVAVGVLAALNALTFMAFALDKHAARSGRRRTPEARLHLLELLGGWPAAGLAQQVLRHKRAKPAYRKVFEAMAALHLLLLALWTFA